MPLRQKLGSIQHHEAMSTGGVQSLADILNHVDRPTQTNGLDALDVTDEDVAAELRQLLFTL